MKNTNDDGSSFLPDRGAAVQTEPLPVVDQIRELRALYDMLNAPASIGLWKVTVFTNPRRLAALAAAMKALSATRSQKRQIARLRREVRELSGYLDRNGL